MVFAVTEKVYFVKGFNWLELHDVDFEVRGPGMVGLALIMYSSTMPSRVAGRSQSMSIEVLETDFTLKSRGADVAERQTCLLRRNMTWES